VACFNVVALLQNCSRLNADCRTHLESCARLTAERSQVRDELRLQLEDFERRETIMEEKRKEIHDERKRLWNTRNNLTCRSCRKQLGGTSSKDEAMGRRTAGDGQNDLVVSVDLSNSLVALKGSTHSRPA
jgi:hypothetical protein